MVNLLLRLGSAWLFLLTFSNVSSYAALELVTSGDLTPPDEGEPARNVVVTEDQALVVHRFTLHFFDKQGSNWVHNTEIAPSSTFDHGSSNFGRVLALGDNTAAVSRFRNWGSASNQRHEILLFTKTNEVWTAAGSLISPGTFQEGYNYSSAIALEGDLLLITEVGFNLRPRVACFQRTVGSNIWNRIQTLQDPSGRKDTGFGASIAVKGPNLIIGAHPSLEGTSSGGCGYAYKLINGRWALQSTLRAPNTANSAFVGSRVALAEGRAALSVRRTTQQGRTAEVALFEQRGDKWQFDQSLTGLPDGISELKFNPDGRLLLVRLGTSSNSSNTLHTFIRSDRNWSEALPARSIINPFAFAANSTEIFSTKPIIIGLEQPQSAGHVLVERYTLTPEIQVRDGKFPDSPPLESNDTSELGQSSFGGFASRFFRIENKGHSALTGVLCSVSGEGFSITEPALSVIQPGAHSLIEVRFTTTAPGSYSGELTISSNDPLIPQMELALTASSLIQEQPATIASLSAGRILEAGEKVRLRAQGGGSEPINYQWLRNGKVIRGANDRTYLLPAITPQQAGSYQVRISNRLGRTTSAAIPMVVVSNQNQTLNPLEGRSLQLSHQVSGPYEALQWSKNGQPLANTPRRIAGVTTTRLQLAGITAMDDGIYTLSVAIAGETRAQLGQAEVSVLMKPIVVPFAQGVPWLVGLPIDNLLIPIENPSDFPRSINLPPGIRIVEVADSFFLTGTPTRAGSYRTRLQVKNDAGISPMFALNLAVQPLNSLAGQYTGLLEPHPDNQFMGGTLQFSVSDSGAISGKVVVLGQTHRFRYQGVWSADPRADSNATFGSRTPALSMDENVFRIQINPALGRSTGSYSNTTPMQASRAGQFNRSSPAAGSGSYTVALQPAADRDPAGASFGILSLSSTGAVRWSGRLADGSAVTRAGQLGVDRSFPVHWPLYQNRGAAQAWLQIGGSPPHEVTGTGSWVKLASSVPARNYNNGFDLINLNVIGASYQRPPQGSLILGISPTLGLAQGSFDFPTTYHSQSALPFAQTFNVSNSTRVIASLPNSRNTKLKLNLQNGLVTGDWREIDGRRGSYSGVLLPHQNIALGYALLPVLDPANARPIVSGSFRLETAAE